MVMEPPPGQRGLSPPIRAGLTAAASLSATLSLRKAPLLASGAVVVVLAQLGLYFAVEPNTKAPLGYLFLLALGTLLFALGSVGVWRSRSSTTSGSTNAGFAPASNVAGIGLGSGLMVAYLFVGGGSMLVLLGLLTAGFESGSSLFIWIVSLVAFAAIFSPRLAAAPLPLLAPMGEWLHRYRWDLLLVALLTTTFLAVNLYDLQHWYYSAIGDEYLFYEHAKRIVDEGIVRPFSQEGVYNKHPVMNSVFQATVMRVFGADYFGWTLSEVLNAALTIPAIYLLGRTLGGRTTAITAAGIFAFSHYIFAFSHTGYTNLSPLPVTAWALALFLIGWRNGNPLLLYAAGVVAGLGFYTHYSGRAIMPVILLFAMLMGNPKRLLALWPLAFGFALTAAPTLVVEKELLFTRMFGQVVGGYTEAVAGTVGQRLLGNIELNLPSFSYNANVHSYVYGPLMDPVSGCLATLGIAFALGHIRQPSYRVLLIWLAVALFIAGILSPYPHTAITRLLIAVPPAALLAGLLFGELCQALPVRWPPPLAIRRQAAVAAMLVILLPAILLLNLWQFWHVTPSVFPHTQEALALGVFRSDVCREDASRTVLVGHATGEGSLMHQMLTAFNPDGPLPHHVNHADLDRTMQLPGDAPRCVVFVNPGPPEARRLQEELARRYPDGRLLSMANPSDTTVVEVFSRQ